MIYYQCKFYQTAPLRIGTGEREDSASDVMTDNHGRPFLPGTGIAGVLRGYFSPEVGNRLFGVIRKDGENNETVAEESRVLVSDATLPPNCKKGIWRVVTRDGIGMNDRGTVLQGAKYDFEVVECKEPYTAVIELPDRPTEKESSDSGESDSAILERALREIARHGVSFGARTTRGYGQMRAEIRKREFLLPDDMDDWLSFDPLDAERFGGDPLAEGNETDTSVLRIRAELRMDGSFSVRQYLSKLPQLTEKRMEAAKKHTKETEERTKATEDCTAEDCTETSKERTETAKKPEFINNVPVYGPMMNQNERPVIPGTSWAGSFRHHMRTLIREAIPEEEKNNGLLLELDELFGTVEKQDVNQEISGRTSKKQETIKKKSRIRFSETEVNITVPQGMEKHGADKDKTKNRGEYTVTRVAVERFTGAPRNQGLFSSVVAWGGRGELSIQLPSDTSPALRRLLAASLNDLHMGLLTVGGESSVGRGLCRIEKLTVNETDVTEAVHSCDTGYIALLIAAQSGK